MKGLWRFGTATCFAGIFCFCSALSAQNTVRITNKGQIVPDNDAVSVLIGYEAGENTTTGWLNTAVGYQSMKSVTWGSNNSAYGSYSLLNNISGLNNVAIGYNAMFGNVSGGSNTAVGIDALYTSSTGTSNSAIGAKALYSNTGNWNSAMGREALYSNTSASYNTAVGSAALAANTTGAQNTGIGASSMSQLINGSNNVAVGYQSGFRTSGASAENVHVGVAAGGGGTNVVRSNCVMVGHRAGFNSTGNGHVFLGDNAGSGQTGNNKLMIHNTSTPTPLIYGEFDNRKLEFNGQLELKSTQKHALVWDAGNVTLKKNADAITSKRNNFRILLDSDNNSPLNCTFELYSNVDTSGGAVPKVIFNLDGGASWISSSNLGIGLTNPNYRLDVAGVINASSGQSGTALRVQGDQAIWYDGVHFSWGFDGQWNRFADSVRIGGGTSPTHLLQVDGVARSTQSTWATSSDRRVKQNVMGISNATKTIMRFRPVTFAWDDTYRAEHTHLHEYNYGFIAQEVEEIIPSMVTTVKEMIGDTVIEDFKVLSTDALIPLLVRTVQEQQDQIAAQHAAILEMQHRLFAIEALLHTSVQQTTASAK